MSPARWLEVAALLAALGAPAAAAAQALDCVIQPKTVARVSSPARGVLAVIEVERGDLIGKGQILARLENSVELAAVEAARARASGEAGVLTGQARLKLGESQLERVQALHERKMVSIREAQEAETARRIAELELLGAREARRQAQLELVQAEAALARRTIRSPIGGVVVEVLGSPGEFFDEQPIFELAALDPLRAEVFAPIALLGRISVGMTGRVEPAAPVGGQYDARVTVVDRIVDAASGTFGVRLEFANPDYAIPAGLPCRVRFPELEPAPASPSAP